MSSDEEEPEIVDNKTGRYTGLRFVSFTKCVAQIGGDNSKLSRRLMLTDATENTFFTDALTKWNDQDYSASYNSFVEEIPSADIQTYAQLLHNKDILATALLKHLNIDVKNKSVPAFCELLAALARDLKEEFDDYMWPAFDSLTNILDFGEQGKEPVEAAFYCLSILIKVLWKKLAKNIRKTFTRFVPLFGSSREYVRRFAAESFAFLMRKLNDLRDVAIFIVCDTFKANDDHLKEGTASLFFNIYKGWSGGFHSAAEQQIAELINAVLSIEDAPQRCYGFEILEVMTDMTVRYSVKHKISQIGLFEAILLKSLESTRSMERASYLLQLVQHLFVDGRSGVIFSDRKRLFASLMSLVAADFFNLDADFATFMTECLQAVFKGISWNLSLRELFAKLLKLDYTINCPEILLNLFSSVRGIDSFDLNIMPYLGELATIILEKRTDLIPSLLAVYSRICAEKRPLEQVINKNRSAFFDATKHTALKQWIVAELPVLAQKDEALAADIVVVWPWLFNTGEKHEGVEHVQKWLISLLRDDHSGLEHSQLCFLIGSAIYLTTKEQLSSIPKELFEKLVQSSQCSQSSVLLLLLHVVSSGEQTDMDYLRRVSELLKPAFFCSNSSKRRAALEVLKSFDVPLEGHDRSEEERHLPDPEGLFKILYDAETTELTDSRSRLLFFRKLLYGPHVRQLPKGHRHEFEHIILRLGLSQFFVQFTFLWPGMHELLSSYARGMDIDVFWTIMGSILEEMQSACRLIHSESEIVGPYAHLLQKIDEFNRSDYLSVRIQVLKFVATISDLAERRTRVLSPLLLEFYEKDFLELENVAEGGDENKKLSGSEKRKALCAYLNIYAKFGDSRSVYLEPKIRSMYDNLLTYPDSGIVKSTVSCLFTYKTRALTPYKENFEALVDEKTFKDQLVLFKILEEDGDAILHVDHRTTVMPVLLRLLYGKLRMTTKKKTAGSRRTAIFRYLGGCRPEELQLFLDIILGHVTRAVGDNEEMFKNMEDLCREKKRHEITLDLVKSTIANISDLVRKISRTLTDDQQTLLLRVLLSLGVVVRETIVKERLEKAKELRKMLMETLTEFLSAFTTRQLQPDEVRQLLSVTVECYLEKETHQEKSRTVLPLSVLRLLVSICRIPSFWPLLAVQISIPSSDSTASLLYLAIDQLFSTGKTPEHVQLVRGGILSLLTLSDEKTAVDLSGISHLSFEINNTNYGTALLVQQLQPILRFLTESLENEAKRISTDNLEVINRLCDFVSDGEIGERMAQILLSQLEKTLPKEDILQKMLLTLGRLVCLVDEPMIYLPRVARLFSTVNGRAAREALCQVVIGLTKNTRLAEELKFRLTLLPDLESWDGRRVDEPDHDRRHAAYNQLFEMWSSDTVYEEAFLSMLIHAHFYALFTTNDIALRSSSASNLRALAKHITRAAYENSIRTKLIDKSLISLILRGFRNEAETVREECVRCLATLVSVFPSHPQLSAFVPLQNKDEDLDFFTNLNHIQLHRRQRCINRLVTSMREGKVSLPFDVLYRFLIPICYHNLASFTSKTSALSDECLRLFNYTLELAPWIRYISTLDHWISRLDKEDGSEKPIIRVIVAIIDAFHFEVADANDKLLEDGTNSMAIAVRDKLMKEILPRLRKCINGKANEVHRKARTAESKHYNEDDDIMRAPVALATTKLLQKLPESIRRQHLHGVILKLCYLMISRSYNVRDTARKVSLQVCDSLGAKYLPSIIKEMKMIMSKGFQIHVMIYTVHTFIYHMQNSLKVGDLDSCLEEILELSIKDQFEDASEEKEVGAIKAEVAEAKGNKTPETLLLLGKFISITSLGVVLEKFQQVLEKKNSSKAVTRVGTLLAKFATGIKDNPDLAPSSQLILVHQVLTSNIEKMETVGVKKDVEVSTNFRPVSCLILPEAPKRVGALVKTSVKSRVHVFVEFALQLLSYLISGKRFDTEDPEDIARLDPFVSLVIRCLALKYDKVITLGLKCISGLLYMNIPSLKGQLKSLSESAGNRSNILQLNQLLFKAFTKIISLGDGTLLTKKNIALLLSYIETDVVDTQKQATAFSLIKAIIRKRIEHERLPEVVQMLAELSVTSPQHIVRIQCRDTVCEFIGNHPQAKEPKFWLEFFTAQLEYEYEDGRLSAAETLHKLFGELLPDVLDENSFFCLLKLAARLVNDENPKCRKFVAATLRKLLEGVGEASREEAAAAGSDWLESEKETARSVGVEILVQLSAVEAERFGERLTRILEAVSTFLNGGELMEENSETSLSAFLDGLVLMLKNSGESARPISNSGLAYTIISRLEPLIKSQDSTVICRAASGLIGQCLSYWTEAPNVALGSRSTVDLVEWMCWQLKHRELTEDLAEQSSKNVVHLSQWLAPDEFEKLIKRLAGICRFETARHPKEAIKRLSCFKLAAALAVRDKKGQIFDHFVQEFFPLLVREMNRKSITQTEELYTLATEIGDLIKTKIGEKEFATRLGQCQKEILDKTEDRKRKIKEMAVSAPEKSAEMKRKKNVKKVEAKKRKLDEAKPHRIAKRKHVEKRRLQADED